MSGERAESCGRCAMSSVVDLTVDGDETDDRERHGRSPFDGDRIEVDDDDLRVVSPAAWLGGLTRRLDDLATRLTYGDRR